VEDRLFVMSTAFVPPNFEGGMRVWVKTPDEIRQIVAQAQADSTQKVVSFCGHSSTAQWLGVEACRGELDGAGLSCHDRLAGIRPLRRPAPGEELAVNPENYQGFIMSPLTPGEQAF